MSVAFAQGLTDREIACAEENYGIQFPPDLREFLQTALPIGFPFPDWRLQNDAKVRELLDAPSHGVLFDVERNNFWLPEWGPRPTEIEEAKALARKYLDEAPRLIPVYSHRMIPDWPNQSGNPVLSVHQTDIIYYGYDLNDYFRHEFWLPDRKPWPSQVREVPFWGVLI